MLSPFLSQDGFAIGSREYLASSPDTVPATLYVDSRVPCYPSASEQDDEVNQEEILRLISESSFETGTMRGSKTHLMRFACEYGDYLSQLRKNVSRGVLGNVEKEIKEHYADNLTLKGLSEKYYVNSAYLGQLFRKKYGQSFKDYLNNYRMDQAVDLLLHSDKKIIQVAEEVGYHDLDYFVNRFIQVKGCTPAKFLVFRPMVDSKNDTMKERYVETPVLQFRYFCTSNRKRVFKSWYNEDSPEKFGDTIRLLRLHSIIFGCNSVWKASLASQFVVVN